MGTLDESDAGGLEKTVLGPSGMTPAPASERPPLSSSFALDATSVEGSSAGRQSGAPGADARAGGGADEGGVALRPFGPFSRVELLAEQGAMGVVARGYNAAFDRWELLKFLRAEYTQSPELVMQFHREGRILAKLSHPNVVQVFAIYALDGQPCLAMEFLEGESLKGLVLESGGKLAISRWHELFVAAARGLAAAHDAGLLHRDIKPENLYVVAERKGGAGGLKLIDFGLATADRNRQGGLHSSDPSLVAAMSGGTPLYMAPELWNQEEASPRSDIYALGMAFFVALTGRLPYQMGATAAEVCVAVCEPAPFPDARELRPELPAALSAVLRRCLAKPKDERFATADELVAALVAAASASRSRRVPGSGPYRGLGSFTAAERDVFFGRDVEIAEILERLRGQAGLLLVGPSGSGKSSLAHAGAVPAIEDGALGGGVVYTSTRFEPRAHPVQSLAAALAHATGSSARDLGQFLRATPDKLGEALRSSLPAGSGLLIVADQLEEIATIAEDASEVRDFSRAVASLVEVVSPEIRLIATLRADLMDRLFAIEPLRPLLTRGFYPVRPLIGDALRRALEGPALAAGYVLEDAKIADAIVQDVVRTPAGLPLLSFAMASWWQARDEARKVLPTAAWRSLGGLAGALVRHGDGVLAAMGVAERAAAELILVRLVSADSTRTRASRAALVDPAASGQGAERALARLIEAKLVHESAGEIELAHEALITQWPALRLLLASSGEDRAFRERVTAAAREWDGQGRPDGALWTGEQSTRLLRWFKSTGAALDQLELAFIDAVRKREARGRLLWRSATFALVVVAVSFGLAAKTSERQMRERLASSDAAAADATRRYKHSEAGRLKVLADAHTYEDPTAALRAALESYELQHDAALDPIAWRARSLGVAFPLPMHQGGASLVRVAPRTGWIATAGLDGTVHVLSPSTPEHSPLLRSSKDRAAMPRALAFSPEGDRLAVGASAGEVSIGKAPEFSLVVATRCEGGHVEELAFHASAALVVRCSEPDGSARLLAVPSAGGPARELFRGALAAFAVAADAPALALATRQGKVTLVDPTPAAGAAADRELGIGRSPGVTALALSPDGTTLYVGEQDGNVRSFPTGNTPRSPTSAPPPDGPGPASSGAPPGAPAGAPAPAGPRAAGALGDHHNGAVVALSAGPDGALLSIGADRVARLHAGGKTVSIDVGAPAFAWLPKRSSVALAGRAGDAIVVSLLAGESSGRLLGASADVTSLDVDARNKWLLVASRDGGVRAYSLDEATSTVTQGPRSPAPSACAVSSEGTTVACAASKEISVLPVAGSAGGPKAPRVVPLPDGTTVSLIAVGPRGEHLAWAAGGRALLDGKPLSGLLDPSLLALSATHLAAAGKPEGAAGGALVCQPASGAAPPPPARFDHPVTAVAFSRDGERLFAAIEGGSGAGAPPAAVATIEPASCKVLATYPLDKLAIDGGISAISVSDDRATLALGSRSGKLITIDASGGKEKALGRMRGAVTCLALSQLGRAAIVASADRRVSVVDGESGVVLGVALATSGIAGCARSPIDDRVSFVAHDGATWVRLLDLSPITMSKAPENPLNPATMPIEAWKGLPEGPLR
jgi:serine/threonine protein kinase/WD40 repeat protein